ncbi:MAG: MBL fold metallo-hydrolase [Phycisphaerales bacterium]
MSVPSRPTARTILARAVRSGLRRYPRELWATLRAPGAASETKRRGLQTGLVKAWRKIEREPAASGAAVAWLGHCTVLIRLAGRTILTDPVLAERVGFKVGGRTIGLSRMCPSPVDAKHLPTIDLVLLSHAHFDHLDKPTLRQIASKETVVVTAAKTRRLVPPGFKRVIEIGWGDTAEIDGLRLTAIRPRHWGARAVWDHHRGYNAYVIEAAVPEGAGPWQEAGVQAGPAPRPAPRIFFAGDTAMTDRFAHLSEHPIDLAVFGVGAYAPWEHAHATPEQVWAMFTQIGAARLLAVHHSTFDMGEEGPGEPMQRLHAAAAAAGRGPAILDVPAGRVVRLG